MAMDPKRKGEIALALLRQRAEDEGIRINPQGFKRDIGNMAKKTGIPKDELVDFIEEEVLLSFSKTLVELRKK